MADQTSKAQRKMGAVVARELHIRAYGGPRLSSHTDLAQPLCGLPPAQWAHGLLWYNSALGVLRLVESGDALETLDGTLHPLRPVWPAHTMRRLERDGLIEWRQMALDFGMMLPKWQQTFVEPKPPPSPLLWPTWLQPQQPALFGVTP